MHDPHESNDLRILDYNGSRAFGLFSFDDLLGSICYEGPKAVEKIPPSNT
jgi:hypothetical protein|tara:strand:+ start:2792 stop:2941 length:150 start_codon:yes stop_codon:yes gene_type:complete